MKKVFVLMALSISLAFSKPYSIDKSHSSVGFEIKHLMLSKVLGSFDNFDGKIDIDPANKNINTFEGIIQIESINTKNQKRDNHLKAPDFFDAEKFPQGTFKMNKYKDGKIYGDLTFRGTTKPVILDVEINGPAKNPMNKREFMALEVEGKINRKDFGIGTSFGSSTLGDEVKINIQLEVYAQ